ncbi:MAG: hypothetical protein K9N48_09160 [Verrucomicrobia bacterium]|nr:hypothetical protein [Verrucomicrobiota bacterium]MCF7709160.1 hypothetical protein [Verrucomicrobiota bacterium]
METYFKNLSAEQGSREKLGQDIKELIRDVESLTRAVSKDITDKSSTEVNAALDRVKSSCKKIESEAARLGKNADQLIRENPYSSLGVSFSVGVILGLWLTRK